MSTPPCLMTAMRGCLTAALLCVVAVGLLPPSAGAQVLYGSIVGNVTDESGAAIPGAAVTIVHSETKAQREMVSGATGAYRFPTVQTGTYTVTVNLQGFRAFARTDVVVTLNNVTRVDVALGVGDLQETLTVSAERPVLQTDRAEIRQELRARELQDLPVPLGRNYQELFRTLPGFTPPEDAHSVPSNPSRALTFNVNGASNQGNNTRIDGVSSTNVWLPHVVAYVPALESIETVNVVTNNFDAEQGLAGGAAISVQIKSGTNDLHGSAFEYHFNEKMRATNYFAPPGTTKGKWRDDQFGGTLGGPLRKNKLFYFASYEATRQTRNVPNTISVPTEAVRRGDFSATGTTIYDPRTGNSDGSGRTSFPGNSIPANRISPVAQKLVAQMPLPNLRNANGAVPEFNNYFIQPLFVFNRWTVDSKVNWNATDRLQVFGRYSQLDFFQNNETVLGEFLQGNPGGGGNAGRGWGDTYNFSAGANYTIGSNVAIDGHFGWVRMSSNVEMSDINQNKGLDVLGIPGTNGPDPWDGGMPWFDLDGYADLGTTQDYMPYYRNDDQYQIVANVNWLKGNHNVRFGSDIYYTTLNHIQPEILDDSFGARGGFLFNPGPTQLRGGPSGTDFNSFAAFLLGLPSEAGRLKLNVAPYTTRSWQYSFYARDQWQITPKLTLSYGTRWEYFPIPTRADRGLERYNIETNLVEIGGLSGVPKNLGISMQKNLFAPRLGAAYRLTETAVIRGGFGVTNDPYSLARAMRTNHPILVNLIDEAPNSMSWVRPIEQGIPIIDDPDLQDGIIPVPGNVTVVTLPTTFKRGRVWSWNVAFEKELKWGFTGQAAYVGTRQIDQLGILEQNYPTLGGGSSSRRLFQRYGRSAPTQLVAPIGDTHYNALQTQLRRRFQNGVQLNVSYTLSKSMGIAGANNSDGQPSIKVPDYYHLNRARSGFDRRHALHISSMAELPFGAGRRWLHDGLVAAVFGGWQVNNILSFYSGTPFTVTASGTTLNTPGSTQMADRVKDEIEIPGGVGRGNSYFDPFAFAPVSEVRFGNAGFNILNGPGIAQWDLGLFRRFNIGRSNLQFRVEMFNVTNRPQFNNPGANRSNLQLNPDGTIRNLNGYTEITSTRNNKFSERSVRLGLRFGF